MAKTGRPKGKVQWWKKGIDANPRAAQREGVITHWEAVMRRRIAEGELDEAEAAPWINRRIQENLARLGDDVSVDYVRVLRSRLHDDPPKGQVLSVKIDVVQDFERGLGEALAGPVEKVPQRVRQLLHGVARGIQQQHIAAALEGETAMLWALADGYALAGLPRPDDLKALARRVASNVRNGWCEAGDGAIYARAAKLYADYDPFPDQSLCSALFKTAAAAPFRKVLKAALARCTMDGTRRTVLRQEAFRLAVEETVGKARNFL